MFSRGWNANAESTMAVLSNECGNVLHVGTVTHLTELLSFVTMKSLRQCFFGGTVRLPVGSLLIAFLKSRKPHYR